MSEPHQVSEGKQWSFSYRDMQFFDDLRHKLNTQDNRITADPIFVVFQKRHQYFRDPDGCIDDERNIVWLTEDMDGKADEKEAEQLNKLYHEDPDDEQEIFTQFELDRAKKEERKPKYKTKFYRHFKFEYNEFVTACFTEAGAQEYIKTNGHNLHEPFIYVMSMWRNEEMKRLRNILKGEADGQPS